MNKKLSLIAPVVICWCFFSLWGCKEPIIEDTNLLTSDDELNLAKDTLYARVFSEFETPITVSNISNGVLGTLTDPNFGTTLASFYFQPQLTTNNVYFGTNPVLDSAVLTLKYNGIYGKFDQPVNISVFELAQDVSASFTYKSNEAFQVKIPAIGQLTGFTPNTTDSITALNGRLSPHIRVRLNDAVGSKILTADSSILKDNASFLNFFKGVYVTSTSAAGNGVVYIDLSSTLSSLTLFYHNDGADSLYYILPATGARVNHFDNVYSGSPVHTSVNSPNATGEEKMFVQAGAGVKGKILLMDLDSLPKNIAINKAELVLSQSGSDTQYLAPLVLDIYRIDDAGQTPTIDDGLVAFRGVRAAETVDGTSINRYRFILTRYFQKLIQGVYHNNGFYLKSYIPNANTERAVIANSSTNKNYQVTLVVTYTKL